MGRLSNTLFGTVKIISQNPCLTGEEKRRTSVVQILAKRCCGLGCSIHKFRKSMNIAYLACNSRIILPFDFDPRIPINTANQGNGTHLSWEFRILSFSLLKNGQCCSNHNVNNIHNTISDLAANQRGHQSFRLIQSTTKSKKSCIQNVQGSSSLWIKGRRRGSTHS